MGQLEGRANLQQSNTSGQPKKYSNSAVPHNPPIANPPSRGNPLAQFLSRGFVFVSVTTVSLTVGLATALMVPLPGFLAPKDQGPRSLIDLLEDGFQYRVSRPVNVLIMGVDRVLDAPEGSPEVFNGRSDTMLLARVDPTDRSISLLSIPRDTQVEVPGLGLTKINAANARGGSKLAAQTASNVLNGVPIDRYVRVSTEALRELVDLLGGVEVFVPEAMNYEDKTQKLKINLAPGLQTLNGDQAEQFARFRYDAYGDIGRVQRQQALLKALRQRLTNPTVIPRIPALLTTMRKYVDTNLSLEEMLALVGAGRKINPSNLKMVMLPGRFSAPGEFVASYWIMNPEGRDRVMRQYFKIDPAEASSNSTTAVTAFKIAIQNASSQPDAANRVKRYLANQGFYNVYIASDWPQQQRQTQIVAQRGDLQGAEDLHKMLGFGKVEAESTGDLESDVTLRIGDDWVNQGASATSSNP